VYLRQTVELALEKHLQRSFPDETIRAEQSPFYQTRLTDELSVIITMDFSGYFLIVSDFIGWAKQNGVPVGPGRGSGAGSLVAFLLGITNLDPLKYDLLFERFLNPERVSMPDFDIDFCQEKRELVIEYVRKKYGKDSVSQIVTFGSMGAKAVLRDVGRVLDMPLGLCDSLAKLVPNNPADPWTLDRAYKEDLQFKEKVDTDDDVNTLFQHAKQLEGITRNVGMHAGGVLIAPGKLTEFCPLYSADEEQGGVVSQFDKDDVEAVGLVKFDFLGLRNLTIIQSALDNMAQIDPKLNDFDLDSLVLDDPLVYKVFENANTTSVFQSESQSAKDLEAKLKPDNFEELIALMALNRPGPLGSGMVDDYIARKNQVRQTNRFDESWYFHPSLTQVLKPTYGVIVYQEQVMLVAQILAGYTLGGADLLRRAMGKKKPEEMAQQRTIFVSGATNNGVEPKMAEYLFDLMEKFAEYGFNKSHSAAYALIAYQTAWLKHYHTAAYMAAVLSSEMQNTDDIEIIYKDTLINQIDILPPDINSSFWAFRPVSRTQIRYGLGAIKGVGQAAVEAMVEERKQGKYLSLFDLCRRVDRKHINRRALESLIRAGAFNSINQHRATLFASVERALHYGEQSATTKNQVGLFALENDNTIDEPDLIESPTWGVVQQLSEEKLALGFNVSGRLFDAYADQVRPFIKTKLSAIAIDNEYWLTGVVVSVRAKMSKRGKLFFVSIEDEADSKEFLIGQQQFEAWKELFKEDQLVIVKVRVRLDKFTGSDKLYIDEVYNLDQARALFLQFIKLRVPEQSLEALVTALKQHQNTVKNLAGNIAPKPSPLKIEYVMTEQSIATELSGAHSTLTTSLLEQLATIQEVSIHLQYS
jgi:DNA polymerase-3 subunit alpha